MSREGFTLDACIATFGSLIFLMALVSMLMPHVHARELTDGFDLCCEISKNLAAKYDSDSRLDLLVVHNNDLIVVSFSMAVVRAQKAPFLWYIPCKVSVLRGFLDFESLYLHL